MSVWALGTATAIHIVQGEIIQPEPSNNEEREREREEQPQTPAQWTEVQLPEVQMN